MTPSKTALLSAFNKTGIESFASSLVSMGWKLLGSKGTAEYLNKKNIPTRDIAEIVGEPILGHRVVTLSREIHAALLATDSPEDETELKRLGISRISLVYVNLYPLREEIAKPDCTLESVIEKTDIGGPTLLRSAAKGRRVVICRPKEFQLALNFISGKYDKRRPNAEELFLSEFASIAEKEVADYCYASAAYHRKMAGRKLFEDD